MITKLRSLWHRVFPVRHPTPRVVERYGEAWATMLEGV